MIIDFHHHLLAKESYAADLIHEMDRLGIDKVCLSGLGIGHGRSDRSDYSHFNLGSLSPDNSDVLEVMRAYPDRVIGFGVIKPDVDTPDTVSALKSQGFRALKITRPREPYNAEEYFPLYQRAEEENMPILFHTGMILTTCFDAEDDVCSDRMRPMLLDRVARRFSKLNMVLAHMGYPWFDEAAAMIRFHENVYADLTASEFGWRNRLSTEDFQKLFFWQGAYDKLLFGTDVAAADLAGALEAQRKLLERLNVGDDTLYNFFCGNSKRLLKI